MGITGMLVILCTKMATMNVQLANTISTKQTESTIREGFFQMMNHQFGSLPGNARLELMTTTSSPPYLYTLTLQNVPTAFTWGGVEKIAKAVQIAGVKRRDGNINVVMRYYENEILSDTSNVVKTTDEKPFAEILLVEDLRFFEWRALDGRTMEWQNDWDLQGRLPLQLEMVTAQGAYGDEMKEIFWIVPKMNPEVVMRNLGQGGNQGGGNGGGPGGSIEGGTIDIGGGRPPGGGGPGGGRGGNGGNGGGRPPSISN